MVPFHKSVHRSLRRTRSTRTRHCRRSRPTPSAVRVGDPVKCRGIDRLGCSQPRLATTATALTARPLGPRPMCRSGTRISFRVHPLPTRPRSAILRAATRREYAGFVRTRRGALRCRISDGSHQVHRVGARHTTSGLKRSCTPLRLGFSACQARPDDNATRRLPSHAYHGHPTRLQQREIGTTASVSPLQNARRRAT